MADSTSTEDEDVVSNTEWIALAEQAWESTIDYGDYENDEAFEAEKAEFRTEAIAQWNHLYVGTQETLRRAIIAWRAVEEETALARHYVEQYAQGWQGGPDDNDDDEGEMLDEGRPTLHDWLREVQPYHLEHARLYNRALAFYQFCPLQCVEDFLTRRMEEYLPLEEPCREAYEYVKTNYARLRVDAENRLAAREVDLNAKVGWFGSWSLGKGGQTTTPVQLWLKQNTSGMVVDRLAIKETGMGQHANPHFWYQGQIGGVPMEIQALYELRALIGSNSIIKIRNWRPWADPDHGYRQYLEFCPFGDLYKLVFEREAPGGKPYVNADRKSDPGTDHSGTAAFVPEPFIWYFLENMTVAGLLMERGELDKHGMKTWTSLLHRDYKPDNVFLGAPAEDKWRRYPEPKLGDWGFVAAITPDIADGTARLGISGTRGYEVPEIFDEVEQVSSKTNVYGMGTVAWAMVMAQAGWKEDTDTIQNQPEDQFGGFDASATAHYSPELLDLLGSCLRTDINLRPSFDVIKNTIERYTSGSFDKAKNKRSAPSDADGWDDEGVALPEFYGTERYRLGMAFADYPDGERGEVNAPGPPETSDDEDHPGGDHRRPVKRPRIEEPDEEQEEPEVEEDEQEGPAPNVGDLSPTYDGPEEPNVEEEEDGAPGTRVEDLSPTYSGGSEEEEAEVQDDTNDLEPQYDESGEEPVENIEEDRRELNGDRDEPQDHGPDN